MCRGLIFFLWPTCRRSVSSVDSSGTWLPFLLQLHIKGSWNIFLHWERDGFHASDNVHLGKDHWALVRRLEFSQNRRVHGLKNLRLLRQSITKGSFRSKSPLKIPQKRRGGGVYSSLGMKTLPCRLPSNMKIAQFFDLLGLIQQTVSLNIQIKRLEELLATPAPDSLLWSLKRGQVPAGRSLGFCHT